MEAPRRDAPRPVAVAPAVVVTGAAVAALVVAGRGAAVVVVDAGLLGVVNKLPNGAVEEVAGAAKETEVWGADVPGAVAPELKVFALGVAEDVVVGLPKRLPRLGALVVDGVCDDVPTKNGFGLSVSDVPACEVAGVEEGNKNGLDLAEPAVEVGG